ncbi:hypothetical protein GWK47_012286 [Chionoecetes opilio]|uniref:Uncharacterized protein n=1 Tax=Chionoecetes opilio TaxID=41210 RepID=A0A8J4XXE6_CHIOP|nr:hypothetical protein GWK47_012286 [Chionoecetes opilio]
MSKTTTLTGSDANLTTSSCTAGEATLPPPTTPWRHPKETFGHHHTLMQALAAEHSELYNNLLRFNEMFNEIRHFMLASAAAAAARGSSEGGPRSLLFSPVFPAAPVNLSASPSTTTSTAGEQVSYVCTTSQKARVCSLCRPCSKSAPATTTPGWPNTCCSRAPPNHSRYSPPHHTHQAGVCGRVCVCVCVCVVAHPGGSQGGHGPLRNFLPCKKSEYSNSQ